jgi:hypothetical protein
VEACGDVLRNRVIGRRIVTATTTTVVVVLILIVVVVVVVVVIIIIIIIIICTLVVMESCACVSSVWEGGLLVLKVLAFSWKSVCG